MSCSSSSSGEVQTQQFQQRNSVSRRNGVLMQNPMPQRRNGVLIPNENRYQNKSARLLKRSDSNQTFLAPLRGTDEAQKNLFQLYNNTDYITRDPIQNIENPTIKNVIPKNVLSLFKNIGKLEFDCFELQKIANKNEITYLLFYIFETNNFFNILNIQPKTALNFFKEINEEYNDNPYHNSLHAFDVTQTLHFFLTTCQYREKAQLSDLETMSLYVAAACHDLKHPGVNNVYLINTRDDLALQYNDKSILENFHCAQAFTLLKNDNNNILQRFDDKKYKTFREIMISTIIGTDMTLHNDYCQKMKDRANSEDFDLKGKDKMLSMIFLVHLADISNPIKEFEVSEQWTQRVMGEFWNQGDKERSQSLPISYLCDRYTTNVAKSQQGFIDFVVKPCYNTLSIFLPNICEFLGNFERNKANWLSKVGEYEQLLEELNQYQKCKDSSSDSESEDEKND